MEEVQLTDSDIKAVVEIIDTVSSRGAFKGEELQFIGYVRNKYNAFLEQVLKNDSSGEQVEEDKLEETEE